MPIVAGFADLTIPVKTCTFKLPTFETSVFEFTAFVELTALVQFAAVVADPAIAA